MVNHQYFVMKTLSLTGTLKQNTVTKLTAIISETRLRSGYSNIVAPRISKPGPRLPSSHLLNSPYDYKV